MTLSHPADTRPESPARTGRPPSPLVTDAARLRVVPWPDPVVEEHGHDPRSWYVETFWLGILGPSTVWLLRRFAPGFDDRPDGFELDLDDTARAIGLGGRTGKHSPFQRALDRCVVFGLARRHGTDGLAVRRALPPLARRHLMRLPVSLQLRHDEWVAMQRDAPTVERLRARARRLALGLVELGDERSDIEVQLVRWHVHPALASEAARWAAMFGAATGAVAAGAASESSQPRPFPSRIDAAPVAPTRLRRTQVEGRPDRPQSEPAEPVGAGGPAGRVPALAVAHTPGARVAHIVAAAARRPPAEP